MPAAGNTGPGWSPSEGCGRSAVEAVGRVGGEPNAVLVGNDIVDLGDPRCSGKARDLRFLKRVCHAEEMSRILSARDADLSLWIHWAAKEAAFKVVSKALGAPPVFTHRLFRVCSTPDPVSSAPIGSFSSGTVEYEGHRVAYYAAVSAQRVHVIAHSSDGPGLLSHASTLQTGEAGVGHGSDSMEARVQPFDLVLDERFTSRERASIHSHASAYVRLLARTALANTLGVEENRLEVVCGAQPTGRVPPTVYLDGRPAPVDLTLSHHGRLVGWAFVVQPRSSRS
jgi:phosphopantetheinyl transferase (holo-ACP synthase)